jgi:hypothetical protein
MHNLAECYKLGKCGVMINWEEAKRWYRASGLDVSIKQLRSLERPQQSFVLPPPQHVLLQPSSLIPNYNEPLHSSASSTTPKLPPFC